MIPIFKSRQFEFDFEQRALFLCDANPDAALRFVDSVDAAVEMLAAHPEMGPVWRHGSRYRPTRFLLIPGFHNYILFYRYENGEILLGRLFHGAQDLGDVLGD